MDPVKHTSTRATKPQEDTHQPSGRDNTRNLPRRSLDRYTHVPRTFDFSAQRCAQPRRAVTPPTAHQQQPQTPAPTGPASPVHPSLAPHSPVVMSATIIIPNTAVGRDAIQLPRNFPGLDFAGFPFRDLVLALTSHVEGNARIAINLHQDGAIHFQVLGDNGQLAPIRSSTEVSNPHTLATGPNGQPLQNQSFIDLLSRITTNAEGIEGSVRPILGENRQLAGVNVAVEIRGFQVAQGSSTRSVTQLGDTRLDSSIPELRVQIPSLNIEFNSVSQAVSISGQALPPDATIAQNPSFTEFFNRNWTDYQRHFGAASPVVTLPPNIVGLALDNVAELRESIGHGDGNAQLYLRPTDTDGRFSIATTIAQAQGAANRFLNQVLYFARQYPSAPPRAQDDGEPLRISSAQRNSGTLFLVDSLNRAPDGTVTRRTDTDLPSALERALGIPSTVAKAYVRDGQIALSEVLQRSETAIRGDASSRLSQNTIRHILDSYAGVDNHGSIPHLENSTLTRQGYRSLDVLAALRNEYRTRGEGTSAQRTLSGGIEWLMQPDPRPGIDGQQVRRSRTWYYADSRYHRQIPNSRGVNATTMHVLPLGIEAATNNFSRGLIADRWIRSVGTTQGNTTAVNILGENRHLQRQTDRFGDVVRIQTALVPEAGNIRAYSQNLRLVPIDSTHTLVIEDLDLAYTGNPLEMQWPTGIHHPLYQVPISTDVVEGESLTNSALGTMSFNPRIGSQRDDKVDPNNLYKLRTAALFSAITQTQPGQNIPMTDRALVCAPADGYDIRQQVVEYLEYIPESNLGPVLLINNDEVSSSIIQRDLARLGVDPALIQEWLNPRAINLPARQSTPDASGARTAIAATTDARRFIPLQALYDAAFKVTPTGNEHFGFDTFDVFRGYVESRLNPPEQIARGLTARTERLWRTLAFHRAAASGRNNGIVADSLSVRFANTQGHYPIQNYFFNDAAYALTRPENNPSAIANNLTTWFLPDSELGITDDREANRVLNAFAEVTRLAENFPQWTPALYPRAEVVNCPAGTPENSTCVSTRLIAGSPYDYGMRHGADLVAFGGTLAARPSDPTQILTRPVSNMFIATPFSRVDLQGVHQGVVENNAEWEAHRGSILDAQGHVVSGIFFSRYGFVDLEGIEDLGANGLSLANSQFPSFIRDMFRQVLRTLGREPRDINFRVEQAIGLAGTSIL